MNETTFRQYISQAAEVLVTPMMVDIIKLPSLTGVPMIMGSSPVNESMSWMVMVWANNDTLLIKTSAVCEEGKDAKSDAINEAVGLLFNHALAHIIDFKQCHTQG